MPENYECKLKQYLSDQQMADIDHWIAKYPADQKQSAVMSALRIVQEAHGALTPELMNAVAAYLDMAPIAVYEVATFYTMYEHEPIGRHLINVCTNVSCMLKGSSDVVGHLQKKLGIKLGQTTEDGRFTLREVECLGACIGAPMMQVDKNYHEQLTAESIDSVLEEYQ